jgi:hypothetical protein
MLAAVEIGKEDLQFINTHVRQWRRQRWACRDDKGRTSAMGYPGTCLCRRRTAKRVPLARRI